MLPKKRGRPKGARTGCDTPGVRYARDYFALIGAGKSKGAAAKTVAAKWGIAVTTVLKARQRHSKRLIDEFNRETDEILAQLGRMLANDYRGPILRATFAEIKSAYSNALEKTAAECERRGNPVAASHARAYARNHAEQFVYQSFGVVARTLLAHIRNKTGG